MNYRYLQIVLVYYYGPFETNEIKIDLKILS